MLGKEIDFFRRILKVENMKGNIRRYGKRMLWVLLITSAVLIAFAVITRYKLSMVFYFMGLGYIAIGGMSFVGNLSMTSNTSYLQVRSVASKSVYESSLDDYKSRNSSFSFLLFMAASGLVLLGAGALMSLINI
jgi:hypothetical protein